MKKTTVWIAGSLFAVAGSAALAQTKVPALSSSPKEALPPVNLTSPHSAPLDAKERYGAQLANDWKINPERPRKGADGSVKYLFGATLPTLVCTPLQVCSIELQSGEIVNDVHAGDSARWKISPASIGNGSSAKTVIIVKPTNTGLVTNLTVTTDRRLYTIKLASTQRDWIPVLSFDYPDETEKMWAEHRERQLKQLQSNTMPTGQNLANLDFGFQLSGDSPSWKPIRVYSDGSKTFIQFPSSDFGGSAPALVALGKDGGLFSDPSIKIVNYRVIGDRYVVDKVLDRAALISGVGRDQVKVILIRGGN
ncbi:P-type conjugative transfer protein TrbG [Comamonas endophytica]|uniref:P-type conjugative transfer protein TrbG n=1 Tax=Comamonas endophytica TaxID=2949090 RepID=A0ABY6GG01_9BURK|nr:MULTISPECIES: P-type conjugative transfer protein TrbG [unclassified Acidovorax]MCD2514662.1 P-type conjugative transfer protein TrbG [Acidovorax sp. D4N7]UYG53974.1 P-type conjugative transfer protein TrbG [Acidovorax sp. 5MLIR]UYG54012.1 P-type conjugative transfer protein TrbG [Acidovorax sp. 5MLIR]